MKKSSDLFHRLSVSPRNVYRLFYPQVPIIVSASDGRRVASMPANSCIPVSDDPPKICVAVRKNSRTNLILKRSKAFSLSWLGFGKRKLVVTLSSPPKSGQSPDDKLASLKIAYDTVLGAPVLSEAIAYAICSKEETLDTGGDHDLFLGKVVGAMADIDFDDYWKFRKYKPVLYLGSARRNPFGTLKLPKRRSVS